MDTEPADADPKRILIVDDEASVRSALTRLLTRNGMKVATSSDGERALARLRGGETYDCMLVDLMMPGMCGMDFVKILARENLFPMNRIIILTAMHNADNATAYLQFGVCSYCGKPWNNKRLLQQIDRAGNGCARPDELDAIA